MFTRFDAEFSTTTNMIYILGGRLSDGSTNGRVWQYDPVSGVYTDTGVDMPVPVSNYNIARVVDSTQQEIFLLFGGRTAAAVTTTTVQGYIPATNSTIDFTSTDPYPVSTSPGGVEVVNNIAYSFGGFDGVTVIANTYIFDITAAAGSRWTVGPALNLGRGYIATGVIDGVIYAAGGDTFDGTNLIAQTIVEKLDTSNPVSWDDAGVADMPVACDENRGFGFDTASPFDFHGKLVTAGCGQWPLEIAQSMIYDAATDTWDQTFPALNNTRRNHAGAFIPLSTGFQGVPGMWVWGGRQTADTNVLATPEFFVALCPAITLSPATLPDGITGVPYLQTITPSGGTAPYTFAVTTGALPPGLTLDPATGDISGTPSAAGSFGFDITVSDANGCSGVQSYTINITCPTITVDPPTLPDGMVGVHYSQTLTASGGTAPYDWVVSSGALPTGLALFAATGQITGTPSAAGTFNFQVEAEDQALCVGTQNYTINIVSCPAITVNPATLPDGQVGTPYSQTVTGSGGTGPYTFAVTAGALPGGVLLDGVTGVISGTPTTVETATFTITATDSIGCTGSSASYTVNIIAACLFCDEFNDGVLATDWTYIKSATQWSEDGTNLIGTNLVKTTTAFASPAFSGCTTCYAETVMATAGGLSNRVWLLFNAHDPKLNLVELMMKQESGRWILRQRINKKVVAKVKFVSTIDPNVFYTARIRYDGTNFIASINGVDALTLPPVGAVTEGTVGFKVKRTTGTFQYIHVN